MYKGQRVTFRTGGVTVEGFVTRLIESVRGVELGAIVSSPSNGSFFLRSAQGRVGDRVRGGLTDFGLDRMMRDNRASGF